MDELWLPTGELQLVWPTISSAPGIYLLASHGRGTFIWIAEGVPGAALYIAGAGREIEQYQLREDDGDVAGVYLGLAQLALEPSDLVASDGRNTPGEMVLTHRGVAIACGHPHPAMRPRIVYVDQAPRAEYFPYEMRCGRWSLILQDVFGKKKKFFERTPE